MKKNPPAYSNREFRSRKLLHVPAYIIYMRGVLRTGSLTRIYDANPGMPPQGGILKFSKRSVLRSLPESVRPKTIVFTTGKPIASETIKKLGLPFICKPDGEERGKGVIIMRSREHRERYEKTLHHNQVFLLQEYISYPEEVGIFWYRDPITKHGTINGITTKEFTVVTGDGKKTLAELVAHDPRAWKYTAVFLQDHQDKRNTIIPQGKTLQLNSIGNHNKGTKFLDGSDLLTMQLTDTINKIMSSIPYFYYGRIDLRVASIEDLQAGKNFMIMEINGIQSEATHMYDPQHSLGERAQVMWKNRCILLDIALDNRKQGKSLHIPFLKHIDKSYTSDR